MKSLKRGLYLGLGLAAALSGCDSSEPTATEAARPQSVSVSAGAETWYTAEQVRTGRRIYAQNCADCHGAMGQGARNWRQRGPDGSFPAPPLNGSGHTWHHPKPMLMDIVKNGGAANMPAWGHKLSDAEIESVLAYVMSMWPEKTYAVWATRVNAR